MMLSDIKRYLQKRRQASLDELACHFDSDPQAMRAMLSQWVQRGRVTRSDLRTICGKVCCSCGCTGAMEIYTCSAGNLPRRCKR